MARRILRDLLTLASIGVGSYAGLNTWKSEGFYESAPKVVSIDGPVQGNHALRRDGFYEDLYEMVRRHEGVRNRAYVDSRGNVTIGVGFNLDSPGARSVIERQGLNFDDVYHGRVALSDEHVDDLFRYSLERAIDGARNYVGRDVFERLDERAREVLVDMTYNLGQRGIEGFRRLREALRQEPPNYERAAREMRDSRWFSQVGRRSRELIRIMQGISTPPRTREQYGHR